VSEKGAIMDRYEGRPEQLEELLGASLEDLHTALSGRSDRRVRTHGQKVHGSSSEGVRTHSGHIDPERAPDTVPEEWS
jgi:hypothetical protein